MVASSPEKLQNKKSFTDLIHLREELTKEAKNKDRLAEFQKTINLALEQGKKKGVIEFTKIEGLKQKAEGLKKYSKPALWFLGLGLSLKIWGYKIANWFSGLFGKKGEYDDKIKLAEMEKEFMKDPEAAMKKYGTEALEKMK